MNRPLRLNLVFMLLMLPGLGMVKQSRNASDPLLPKSGVRYEQYQEEKARFGGQSVTLIVFANPREHWDTFVALHGELEALPMVSSITSLARAAYPNSQSPILNDDFGPELTDTFGIDYVELAQTYPPYRLLLTPEGDAAALYLVANEEVDAVAFDADVEAILDRYRAQLGVAWPELFQVGETRISAEVSRQIERSQILMPFVLLLMFGVVRWRTGSWVASMMAVATGIEAVLCTFAAMGYLGVEINPVNSLAVNILIPLGTAFAVHAYGYAVRDGERKYGYLPVQSIPAFAFATLTTLLGYGLTARSSIPAIQHFAFGCLGIVTCLFATYTLSFPLFARFAAPRHQQATPRKEARLVPGWFSVLATVGLFGACYVGLTRINVNYAPAHYLDTHNRVHAEFMRSADLFGTYTFPVTMVYPADQPGDAMAPRFQHRVRDLCRRLEAATGARTSSLFDQLDHLYPAFFPEVESPPTYSQSAAREDREVLAQLREVLSWHDSVDISTHFSADDKCFRVFLVTDIESSSDFNHLKATLFRLAEELKLEVVLAGREAQFFETGDLIPRETLVSFAIAIVVLFLLFTAVMRSPIYGIIATVVNGLPVAGALAVLGYFGMDLDLGSSLNAVIALGIAVDDTAHLMFQFKHNRAGGLSPRRAAADAVAELRRPMTTTTITVIIGFLVLNMSQLVPYQAFSRVLAGTMALAWAGDVFLLPSLLSLLPDRR